MGCKCFHIKKTHNIQFNTKSQFNNDIIEIKKIKKNYFNSTRLWINILDYLPYKDLYQVGKLNRY